MRTGTWRGRLPRWAMVAWLAAAAGCAKNDSTILLVEIAGPITLTPSQLRVTITTGLEARSLLIPPTPRADPITLPTSFSLTMDHSRTAPITVSIDALDAQSSPVGFGTTMQDHINLGGTTIIAVLLTEGAGPDTSPDAGAAGAGGGGAGGGGAGAAGGGAGAGGGGAGGASSADAAPGLDGARD
jgi:hypothetical protein